MPKDITSRGENKYTRTSHIAHAHMRYNKCQLFLSFETIELYGWGFQAWMPAERSW